MKPVKITTDFKWREMTDQEITEAQAAYHHWVEYIEWVRGSSKLESIAHEIGTPIP